MWQVILFSIFLGLMASLKAYFQGRYAKKYVKNNFDTSRLIFLSFLLSTLIILPFVIAKNQWSIDAVKYGLLAGLFSFIYQIFYTLAFKKGPLSLTVLINSLFMLFPILFSVFFYKESFTLLRIIGTCLIVISFILNTKKDPHNKTSLSWLFLATLMMAFHALINIAMKYFSLSTTGGKEIYGFVLFMYISTTILSLIYLLFIKFKNRKDKENKYNIFISPGKPLIFTSLFLAIDMAVYDLVDIYATGNFDGPLYFPLNSGLMLIFSIGIAIFINKEKLSWLQYLAFAMAIAAIIVLSIN